MKKIILVTGIIGVLIGCINDRKTGIPYRSESIKESKKRNSFINNYSFEYKISPKSKELLIREAWTEKEWEYKDQKGNLNYTEKNNFVIKFIDDSNNADFSRGTTLIISKINDSLNVPFDGGGKINNGIYFDVTNYKKEIDSFRLYFFYKGDKIPIFFKKKL